MAPKRPVSTGAAGKMKQGSLFSFFNKKKEATPAAATAPAPAPAAKAASNANANPYSKGTSASTTAKALAPSRPSAAASAPAKAALPSASTTAKPKTKTSTNNNNNTNNDKAATTATAPLTTGTRVEVYWPDDDLYYAATITRLRQRQQQTTSYLEYEDGQCEWIDLSTETYRVLSSADPAAAAAAAGAHQQYESNKRRRIHLDDNEDDSDEEAEFDMDDASASDGSAYKEDPKANQEDDDEEEYDEEEEDDEDQWMVTDDEDDTGKKKKRKTTSKKSKAPTLQVTEHLAPTKTITSARSTTTTPSNISTSSTKASSTFVSPAASKNTLANFSYSAQSQSQLQSQSQSQSQSSQKPQETQHRSPHMPQPTQQSVGSPLATTSTTNTTIATTQKKIVPMYTKGAVNPAGSHVHNHLKFLQHRRDAQGRTPDHADYDPRTLKVVLSDWVYHCDKMTDAVKQWWDLKAQYMDTVLLFKTGKFYELFHMDADAGVQALGCAYMKGHVAHAGFPEISYGSMSHKLVLAGYKVARVEQTETPDMLKIRKSKFKKGRSGATAPKVVNREVCSVMTMGTRTFCFLDDESGIVESDSNGTGPLLAIREVLLDPMDVENVSNSNNNATSPSDVESAVQPVCEYGITLVDAVRGTVTLGQFADDVLRSRMNTLLATFSPSEVRYIIFTLYCVVLVTYRDV
jgi:DNA mismatch repair protein MSH6